VLERVLHVVVAADHVRDALVDVVHHVREVKDRRTVGADDREVRDVLGLLRHVSLHEVVELDHALLRHPEHRDDAGLAVAGRALDLVGAAGGEELFGDGETLMYSSYRTGKTEKIEIPPPEVPDHHGGGDFNLVNTFVDAVRTRDKSHLVTGPEISLETHFLVFAAEIARKQKRVLEMKRFFAETGAEQLINHP